MGGYVPAGRSHLKSLRATTSTAKLKRVETVRNVVFALLGGIGLVLKPVYQGPLAEIVYSYGGNFAVSFALYFAALSAAKRSR